MLSRRKPADAVCRGSRGDLFASSNRSQPPDRITDSAVLLVRWSDHCDLSMPRCNNTSLRRLRYSKSARTRLHPPRPCSRDLFRSRLTNPEKHAVFGQRWHSPSCAHQKLFSNSTKLVEEAPLTISARVISLTVCRKGLAGAHPAKAPFNCELSGIAHSARRPRCEHR